jgi:hypothetical protein
MKSILITIFCLMATSILSKDKGIGILSMSSDLKGTVHVNIYEKNSSKSKLLGSFIQSEKRDYKIQSKLVQTDNLIEFEYEISGIPISEVNNNWLRVIYGYDKSGKALMGWIEHKKGITRYLLWKDYLKEQDLFFESTDQIIFFDKPNGSKVGFKLEPSEHLVYDYIMKPIEVSGNWMKVEVFTPSNNCNTPINVRKEIFWIKYLNDRGRPLVWYFTRGC